MNEGEPSNMSTTVQRVLIVAVLLVSVILVIRSFTAPVPEPAPPSPPLAVPPPPAIDPAQLRIPPEIAALFPPGEAAPTNPDATWISVGEFNGQEAGRTPTFELSGNTTRIRYTVDGDLPFFALFFVPANQTQASAFPDVISTNQKEGEATIAKPAGSYYLTVQTIQGGWSVAVDEEQVL
jgi:hypothetical protein